MSHLHCLHGIVIAAFALTATGIATSHAADAEDAAPPPTAVPLQEWNLLDLPTKDREFLEQILSRPLTPTYKRIQFSCDLFRYDKTGTLLPGGEGYSRQRITIDLARRASRVESVYRRDATQLMYRFEVHSAYDCISLSHPFQGHEPLDFPKKISGPSWANVYERKASDCTHPVLDALNFCLTPETFRRPLTEDEVKPIDRHLAWFRLSDLDVAFRRGSGRLARLSRPSFEKPDEEIHIDYFHEKDGILFPTRLRQLCNGAANEYSVDLNSFQLDPKVPLELFKIEFPPGCTVNDRYQNITYTTPSVAQSDTAR